MRCRQRPKVTRRKTPITQQTLDDLTQMSNGVKSWTILASTVPLELPPKRRQWVQCTSSNIPFTYACPECILLPTITITLTIHFPPPSSAPGFPNPELPFCNHLFAPLSRNNLSEAVCVPQSAKNRSHGANYAGSPPASEPFVNPAGADTSD
jgi:hypothetical protein